MSRVVTRTWAYFVFLIVYHSETNMEKTPAGKECEVCSKGEQATHECVECQQVMCTPCHSAHGASQSCKAHMVLPLTASVIPEGCGERRCSVHKNQLLLLYCCQCEVSICMVCKMTSHEDHKIEDVMDTGKRARAELTEELQVVSKREQVLRAFLTKAQEFEEDLNKEKQETEKKIIARANELKQLVDKAQTEALESVVNTTEKAIKDLKQQSIPIEERHAATSDNRQNISRIVAEGEDNEAIDLLTRIKEAGAEKRKSDKSQDNLMVQRGTVRYEFRIRAVKYTNVLAFIGSAMEGHVLEAKASAMGAESLDVAVRPGPQSLPNSQLVLGKHRMSKVRPSSFVEIYYSKNPKSTLAAMHLMPTDDEFWLNFNPGGNVPLFALFDDEGQMKEVHSEDIPTLAVLITCDGDTVVSVSNGRWVRPGYEAGALENFTAWNVTAVSKSSTVYLLTETSFFRLLSDDLPPKVDQNPTCTVTVSGRAFDLSVNGEFVAIASEVVKVFDKIKASTNLRSYADYVEANGTTPSDVCFCSIDGKEVLLVAYSAQNTVHVLDHKDGCNFIRTLETDKCTLNAPCLLATNHHGRVWVGCNGGKVVIFDV